MFDYIRGCPLYNVVDRDTGETLAQKVTMKELVRRYSDIIEHLEIRRILGSN